MNCGQQFGQQMAFGNGFLVAGDFDQRRLLYKLETLCLGKENKKYPP